MIKKKRFYVILLVLFVMVPIFSYAQMRIAQERMDKYGDDWRRQIQQAITDNQNSLGSDRVPEEFKKYRKIYIQQMRYYLDNDVNPQQSGGITFTKALALIACLVFHEYGHIRAMKYFGMKTKGIYLIPFLTPSFSQTVTDIDDVDGVGQPAVVPNFYFIHPITTTGI